MKKVLQKLDEIDEANFIPKRPLHQDFLTLLTYIGVILVCVLGFINYDKNVIASSSGSTQAVVAEDTVLTANNHGGKITTRCDTKVEYSVGSQNYKEFSPYQICDAVKGDVIDIAYDTNNHEKFIPTSTLEKLKEFNNSSFKALGFGTLGYSFAAFSLFLYMSSRKTKSVI